ncbi:MAG TPA: hypothetical protein VMT11_11545 [Myxococcaceae bacterium]|nr:hypothetical protein [Myxococcaceae bacterium]
MKLVRSRDARILPAAPNIGADTTLNGNIPLYLETSVNVIDNSANPNPLGVTLTLQAGAELRFKPGADYRMIFGGRRERPEQPRRSPDRARNAHVANPLHLRRRPARSGRPGGPPAGHVRQLADDVQHHRVCRGLQWRRFDQLPPDGLLGQRRADHRRPRLHAVRDDDREQHHPVQRRTRHRRHLGGGDAECPNLADPGTGNLFNNIGGCKQTYNGLIPGVGSCPVGGGCTEQ